MDILLYTASPILTVIGVLSVLSQIVFIEQGLLDVFQTWIERQREIPNPCRFLQHSTDEHRLFDIFAPGKWTVARNEHRLRAPVVLRPEGFDDQGTRFVLVVLCDGLIRYHIGAGDFAVEIIGVGGAKTGKEVSEYLMKAGLKGDEVIRGVLNFMEYCKVGKVTRGKTIRMKENCEVFGLETGEHCCFFTTGFFNGLFSSVKSQHVREIKCIAAGDPYCEWEII